MQFLRRIFFYIFAAIYIVFCPLTIMYALGYIFKPGAEKGVEKTGLIYLSSAPAGATVYMNSSKYTKKTPTVIQELLPAGYSIRLELNGYKQWGRTVPVEAEQATVLDKILLLPQQFKFNNVLSGEFRDIIQVPRSGFFLVKKGPLLEDIQVYDYNGQKAWPLLEAGDPFSSYKLVSYFSVKESPFVLLVVRSGKQDRLLWVGLAEDKNEVKDITDLFSVKPQHAEWLPRKDTELFVFQEGYLNKVDVASGAVYPDYIQNVRGFGLYDNEVYVLGADNVFFKTDYDKKSEKKLLDDPTLGSSIFGEKGYFRVEVLSDDFIFFIGKNGELLANRLPYRFVREGVLGVEFYPQLKQLLIWRKDRIGILDLSVEETGEVEFEKGPALVWLYRKGKNIGQCFWVYQGSHILFRDGTDVSLVAMEEYGGTSMEHILKVKEKSAIYYSEQTGSLYYIDPDTGNIFSVEIVPRKGVITAPFPKLKEQEEGGKPRGS
ncbi:MAG: PEGA domain-containing protein [Candidatus Omnitrophota bacterium]|nr:PEGA domain-containing protein [Candidatus Omnitrophota bacterium]